MNLSQTQSSSPKDSQQLVPLPTSLLQPLRQWLNEVEVCNPTQAHFICRLIPAQCPFERDIRIGQRIHFHIPPLCKLNPLYEELVSLRFRSLCYLAEECSIDVCHYC